MFLEEPYIATVYQNYLIKLFGKAIWLFLINLPANRHTAIIFTPELKLDRIIAIIKMTQPLLAHFFSMVFEWNIQFAVEDLLQRNNKIAPFDQLELLNRQVPCWKMV